MTLGEDSRVLRFVQAAEAFVRLVNDPGLKQGPLVRAMLSAVSELYAAGVALESVEAEFAEGELPKDNVNRVEFWKELSVRFTPHSLYWMVFDPLDDKNTEPVAGDLGDDMADIYFDIVPGLKGWQSGESSQRQRAVWSWQFTFRTHWGNHALGALPALHWLVTDRGI